MATKFFRKRNIYVELEAAYAVAETLVGADVIRTRNLTLDTPYGGDRVSQDLDRPELGGQAQININPHVGLSFDVPLAGGGAAGTAPKYADLLLACAMAETVNAGVDVQYDPVSEPTDSVTIGLYLDGELHTIPGARGNWQLLMERGLPYLRFTMMGLYQTPIAGTPPTPDYTGWVTSIPITKANTPTTTIGGVAYPLHSITCDAGIPLVARNIPQQEEILQPDRNCTGQIVINRPDISINDIYSAAVESHEGLNTVAVQVIHGTVAGNICQFDAPAAQLSDIGDQDIDGIAASALPAAYLPNSGDDDVKLTFK